MDVQTVWECGLNDFRVSTDGAQTWKDVEAGGGGNGCMLSFVDDKVGWVRLRRALQMTTDGGETLEEVALPEGIQEITGISLRTPTDGYLVDTAGVLYVTQDGGQSWSSRSLGLDLTEYTIIPAASVASTAIRFTDADHGVVVLNLAGGGEVRALALHTSDGGQTWAQETVASSIFGVVPYLSPDGTFLTLYDSGTISTFRYKGF